MAPVFFRSTAELRGWLAAHHARAAELWVGFHRKASGRGGLTYHEALDEALCFGWIDGVRKKLDEERWTIRFTPRKPKSYWSRVNVRRAEALVADRRMAPAGLKALEARERKAPGRYSFERKPEKLDPAQERRLVASGKAWDFFRAQPAWYQRTARWWVISAVREETRRKRLDTLLADSARGLWIAGVRDRQPKTAKPKKPPLRTRSGARPRASRGSRRT